MTRWARQPVVHFVAIGGLLFAAKNFAFGSPRTVLATAVAEPSVVTSERIEELRGDWLARTGRSPGERELEALLRAEVDDVVLVIEARRLGYHRTDPVVQRRLLRNMSFLAGETERSPADLLDEAYALGMDATDLVVRRRLIQKLELGVFAAARAEGPSDAELAAYLEKHAERYTQPARVRLSHVFLSRDRRGDSLDADAAALRGRLARSGPYSPGALDAGDPFLFPPDLPPRSERELAKTFGPEFAARAMALPAGRWSGPLASAYGLHLVWVHGHTPAAPARLAAVRGVVREALLAERGERALREYIEELRQRHAVRVEGAVPSLRGAG